jgi:hypothetical protein
MNLSYPFSRTRWSTGLAGVVLTLGLGFGLLSGSPTTLQAGKTHAPALLDFNRDIRPILADNCFACHGPDKHKRKAGLRLDRREEATARLDSGDRAIVPGDVAASKLLRVVVTENPEDRMPPPKTGKRLTLGQVGLLREWIAQGAVWKEHWAYLSPERPPTPLVRQSSWPRSPLDSFILARLEKEHLRPSPEADKATLLRRVTLDLTGLPPTLPELETFLADKSADAYGKVVDGLLDGPAFGERMAQWWLDLARYADSDGYHADIPRSMWQYRDYVIRSFNTNKPFDQFTMEQLAGDLLPNATVEQRIATAFNRNGMSSTEGGADPEEYLNKYVTDRVNTFGTVFLGSSIACTECHDHKYDPFTQREYYQLYDFFNRIPEKGLDSDPAPPFIKVPTLEQTATLAKQTNEIAELESKRRHVLDRSDPDRDHGQSHWEDDHRRSVWSGWEVPLPRAMSARSGASFTMLGDRSLLVGGSSENSRAGTNDARDSYEVTLRTDQSTLTALRLEAIPHSLLPRQSASRATNGQFVLTGFEVEARSLQPSRQPAPRDLRWKPWSLLGPFKAASGQEGLGKSFITETNVDLSKTYEDGKIKWTEPPAWTEGTPLPLWGEGSITYFHRTFTSPDQRDIVVQAGSDGGMQLWLNDTKVEDGKTFRGTAAQPDPVLLRLRQGENRLLLKVHHGSGAKGFLAARPEHPLTNYQVLFTRALTDEQDKDHPAKAALDNKADSGWMPGTEEASLRALHQVVFVPRQPVQFEGGIELKVRLQFQAATNGQDSQALGRFRLALRDQPAPYETFAGLPQAIQTAFFQSPGGLTSTQRTELKEYYRDQFDPELKELNPQLAAARKAQKDLYNQIPTIRVMDEMTEPRSTQIRVRGDYRHRGDTVTAGVPHVLPPLPPLPAGARTNRLALARWLVDPQHPLLSRVTVNRLWALCFGTGLVKTGNEFGTQGELPSHPELLDWLARQLIDTGWNIKGLLRTIVTSATYRQSSHTNPELLARDPNNRLLARGPRLRLSAEMVRDCALDYAGLLDRKRPLGGPSVKPYQPAGLWEEKMFGGNKYEESKGADLYRRSLYTLWKRTVLNPTLMTFDAPDRAICTEQRSLTCTPLQALVTLNEKTFVEAARMLAARILREGGSTTEQRLSFACRTVLARPPSEREKRILTGVHRDMSAAYQKDLKAALDLLSVGESKRPQDVNELELVAWTAVANVLLNLDETITKE